MKWPTLVFVLLSTITIVVQCEWVSGTKSTLTTRCKNKNMRFLVVNPTNLEMFSAVCESGGSKTLWYLDLSKEEVQKKVNDVNGELTMLLPYYSQKSTKEPVFGVIITPSSQYQSFWYWGLTSTQLKEKARGCSRKGRISSLFPYVTPSGKRLYAMICTKQRSKKSKILIKISLAQLVVTINSLTSSYQVAALYPGADGLFDVFFIESNGVPWWYYWGISEEVVKSRADEKNACITSAVPTGDLWAVTMVKCRTTASETIATARTTPSPATSNLGISTASGTASGAAGATPSPSVSTTETTTSISKGTNGGTAKAKVSTAIQRSGNGNAFAFSSANSFSSSTKPNPKA